MIDDGAGRDPAAPASIQELVRKDLMVREQEGIRRYGTPLQPHNGRDALLDAYEECLDMACYLRQAIEEAHLDRKLHQPQPAPQAAPS